METGTSKVDARATIPRPPFVWLGVALQVVCGVLAIPIGIQFILDPTGSSVGLPPGWIEATAFGSYLVPGLYLLAMNGIGMLIAAALAVRRHPLAPWLMGGLGIGLMIWIAVQIAIMPEYMILQPILFGFGLAMGFVALFWLRAIRRATSTTEG
jgi:uncharacterized membrane protein